MKGHELQKMLSDKFAETGQAGAEVLFVDAVNGTVFEPTGEAVIDFASGEAIVYLQETE